MIYFPLKMYIPSLNENLETEAINTPSAQTMVSVHYFLLKCNQGFLSDLDLEQEVYKVSLRYLVIPESKKVTKYYLNKTQKPT